MTDTEANTPVTNTAVTNTGTHAATHPLVRAVGLRKVFARSRFLPWLYESEGAEGGGAAVDDVSLELGRGEALGLVGGSGSGKSTTGRLILNLIPPDAGTVHFDGVDLSALSANEMREKRARMQMVFQDPLASLNPRIRVGAAIREPMDVHQTTPPTARDAHVERLLAEVGLESDMKARYPHQLSGGQRQRVGIARALATDPWFIVADEPISNLDVSIQAQILNLFAALKAERGLTLLFIAHDLGTVRHLCDRVAVMNKGRIVEEGPTDQIFDAPTAPYTQELLQAIPRPPA